MTTLKPSKLPYLFPDGSRVEVKLDSSARDFLYTLRNHPKINHSVQCTWTVPPTPLETHTKNQMTYSGWLPASGFFK